MGPEKSSGVLEKPTTNQELWGFIAWKFGINLPWRAYTAGHSSPFGFLADAVFNPDRDYAAWACRSGGKTLIASITARVEHLFDSDIQSRVLSGSEDQAKNLYGYWGNWSHTVYPQQVSGKVNIKRTRINGGKMEILTASQKSVRGPKVQRLYIDEIDEVDSELIEAAAGMLATREGIPARTLYASTWHRVGGSMGKMIDKCPDNGVKLHRWNIWECITQCPQERHDNGSNCHECPLGVDCLEARALYEHARGATGNGVAGIAAEPFGIFAVEDAIKCWQKLSRPTIDAEFLCKRPSADGLVYPSFDPLMHKCLTRPDDLTIYRAIDWGYNAFVCLWIGVDKAGTIYLLDTYKAETAKVSTNAQFIKQHAIQDVRDTFCDPAGRNKNDQTGRSDIEEFAKEGIVCHYRLDQRSRNVNNGIKLVRNHLNPAAGKPRLYYVDTPQNRIFATAMQSYVNRKVNQEWIDEPQDPQEYEHIPDALRYFFVNKCQGPSVMSGRPGVS